MSATIAYLLVVGVLAAGAARAGEEMLRLAQRPARWAWAGALALLLVLTIRAAVVEPAAVATSADVTLSVDARQVSGAPHQPAWVHALSVLERSQVLAAELPRVLAQRIAHLIPAPAATGIAIAWGAMSAAMLVLLVVVYRRFSVAMRTLPSAELHGTPVRVAAEAGPAAVGIVHPQILVPAWLLDASPEEQRLAVTHEREHIAARDPQLILAACVAVAVVPWHPAAWWMLSRLRLAVEMDCDRRVLAAGVPRRLYGSTLIDIAARGGRLPLGAPALADHTTHLERRLIAMAPTTPRFRRTRLLAVAAGALLTVAAACEARLPSSPEIEAMDVAAVENNAMAKTALGTDTTIAYYVDGARVTAEASRTIAAQDIASIAVNKGAAGSEIRITTKAAVGAGQRAADTALYREMQKLVALPKVPGDSVHAGPPPAGFRPLTHREYEGLIVIDGRLADDRAIARLTPDRILSMEVLKGEAARRRYDDPRAAKGVIVVTTKG